MEVETLERLYLRRTVIREVLLQLESEVTPYMEPCFREPSMSLLFRWEALYDKYQQEFNSLQADIRRQASLEEYLALSKENLKLFQIAVPTEHYLEYSRKILNLPQAVGSQVSQGPVSGPPFPFSGRGCRSSFLKPQKPPNCRSRFLEPQRKEIQKTEAQTASQIEGNINKIERVEESQNKIEEVCKAEEVESEKTESEVFVEFQGKQNEGTINEVEEVKVTEKMEEVPKIEKVCQADEISCFKQKRLKRRHRKRNRTEGPHTESLPHQDQSTKINGKASENTGAVPEVIESEEIVDWKQSPEVKKENTEMRSEQTFIHTAKSEEEQQVGEAEEISQMVHEVKEASKNNEETVKLKYDRKEETEIDKENLEWVFKFGEGQIKDSSGEKQKYGIYSWRWRKKNWKRRLKSKRWIQGSFFMDFG